VTLHGLIISFLRKFRSESSTDIHCRLLQPKTVGLIFYFVSYVTRPIDCVKTDLWRLCKKIIRTVLCCIVCDGCA